MHPAQTISFTRQLEDGSSLEISMSFRFTRTDNSHMQVAVVDANDNTPQPEAGFARTSAANTRLPKETDTQYLQRLTAMGQAEPRILSQWAKHLKTSQRKLVEEKRAGRIKYTRKRETRAGNAHLITVTEMIKTVERLGLAG